MTAEKRILFERKGALGVIRLNRPEVCNAPVEMVGNRMLFGIDAARQAIWQRQQRELAAAREEGRKEGRAEARDEGRKEGRAEAREEGRKEGYQQGYDAGVYAAQRRSRRRRILRNDR